MKQMTKAPTPRPGSTGAADGATMVRTGWRSLQWWPTLVGVGFAAFVALDLFNGTEHGAGRAIGAGDAPAAGEAHAATNHKHKREKEGHSR